VAGSLVAGSLVAGSLVAGSLVAGSLVAGSPVVGEVAGALLGAPDGVVEGVGDEPPEQADAARPTITQTVTIRD
jgi:hypothetical protein